MSQFIFDNPNMPAQPKAGVYRWYCQERTGKQTTIYVGRSGNSTLWRGASEIFETGTVSNDHGRTIETDFILATVLPVIMDEWRTNVHWEHISDIEAEEVQEVRRCIPILQTNDGNIDQRYKFRRENEYWRRDTAEEARQLLREEIRRKLADI